MSNKKEALLRKLSIESSHAFAKLEEKTQILISKEYKPDIFRTRQTHSYEVSTIASIIALNIGFEDIELLVNVCLCHDLGHPPFGHTAARYMNSFFIEKGLIEGFCDNASIFEVLINNSIKLSNYEIASLIKYPNKLYPNNTFYLNNLLNIEIDKEKEKWGQNLKRTVACEIMDLADMISYATSDLVDSFITEYTVDTLANNLKIIMDKLVVKREYIEILEEAINAANLKNKRLLRKSMIQLKEEILNDFYWDKNLSKLVAINKDTEKILNALVDFNFNSFIKNELVNKERDEAIEYLKKYLNYFLRNPDKMISSFYKNKYMKASNDNDRLRAIRDMVADTSDQFLIKWCKKNKKILI